MRCWYSLVLTAAVLTCQAEVIDRIAVTVGKVVITESDLIIDQRISTFLDQKPVDLSGPQKRQAADRLVDQTLILQEADVIRVPQPAKDEITRMLRQVKAEFSSGDAYQAALKSYQITEAELVAHLTAGLRAMRFADLRFRPEIQLSPDEVRDSYDQMVAGWKQSGQASIPTFEASRADMEKLLTDQRVSQSLDRWLGSQRNQTEIIYREPAFK